MLRFQVKGSAREPYNVTADGSGLTFAIYCSCPAGRRGGNFCKHAAALLLGDLSNLVMPSDSVEELIRLAAGSDYPALARQHVPADQRRRVVEGYVSLEQVEAAFRASLEAKGWVVARRSRSILGDEEFLELFATTKFGKPRKQPAIALSYHSTAFDMVEEADGSITYSNPRPRARPWRVRGGGPTGTWSTLAAALPGFLDAAGIGA